MDRDSSSNSKNEPQSRSKLVHRIASGRALRLETLDPLFGLDLPDAIVQIGFGKHRAEGTPRLRYAPISVSALKAQTFVFRQIPSAFHMSVPTLGILLALVLWLGPSRPAHASEWQFIGA